MSKETKTRNTYLDLLKVIGIFLVVMYHVHQNLFMCYKYDSIYGFFAFIIIYCAGNIGNCIFITISAYYLIKSKGPKLNKIIFLLIIEIISAILMTGLTYIFKIERVNKRLLKGTLFPFYYGFNYWYINAYIVYYMIHGYLNRLIYNITKKEHRIFLFVGIMLCMVLPLGFKSRNILNDLSFVTSFIIIHFLVSYIDKYKNNIDFRKYTKIFACLYLGFLILLYSLDIIFNTNNFKSLMSLDIRVTRFYNILLLVSKTLQEIYKYVTYIIDKKIYITYDKVEKEENVIKLVWRNKNENNGN